MKRVKRAKTTAPTTSIASLKRELVKRERELKALSKLEKSLRMKLATVERKKATLLGAGDAASTPKRRRKRAAKKPSGRPAATAKGARRVARKRRKPSVAALIVEIAREHPKGIAPAQITELLLKRGVKTKSKNFRKMVAISLGRNPGLKRIKQGLYTAKA